MNAKRIEEIYALHGLQGQMASQLARAHEHVMREWTASAAQGAAGEETHRYVSIEERMPDYKISGAVVWCLDGYPQTFGYGTYEWAKERGYTHWFQLPPAPGAAVPKDFPPVAEAGENPSEPQQKISGIRAYWSQQRSSFQPTDHQHQTLTAFIRDLDRIAGSIRDSTPAIVAAAKREAWEEAAKELEGYLPTTAPVHVHALVVDIANCLRAKAASTGISLAPTPATAGEVGK